MALACEIGPDALKPAPENVLRFWLVSWWVNRTRDADNPTLIEEVLIVPPNS